MRRTILAMAFSVLALLCACKTTAKTQTKPLQGLNPMESVVCQIDKRYCIVRNDESRHNPLSVRHRKTFVKAFDTSFEKYLDPFTLDGKSIIVAAFYNPAFDYMWNAWVRDGKSWKQLLPQPCRSIEIIPGSNGSSLKCTDMEGNAATYTLKELTSKAE